MRRDRLFSMEVRLRRFRDEGTPGILLGPEARNDAQGVAEALADDHDRACHFALGLFHWYRSGIVPPHMAPQETERAENLLLPCYLAEVPGVPEPLVPSLAGRALRATTSMIVEILSHPEGVPPHALMVQWQRSLREASAGRRDEIVDSLLPFSGSFAPSQVDCLIDLARGIVACTPVGHPDRATRLEVLAHMHFVRFTYADAEADLQACRDACRAALEIVPPGHVRASEMAHLWRNTERLRLQRSAQPAELDEAVDAARRALTAAGVAADRRERLFDLAAALEGRFKVTGSLTDLQEAVDAYDDLVRRAPADHPGTLRFDEMSALVGLLLELHQRTRRLTDLDRAIAMLRLLVDAEEIAVPARVHVLESLVANLTARFEQTDRREDLDAAVQLLESFARGLPADSLDTAEVALLLGRTLQLRAHRLEQPADLDGAVVRFRQAAKAPARDGTLRLNALGHLGSALRERGERAESRSDLDTSVAVCREAVDEAPPGHPLLPSLRTNLAASHNARHRLTNSIPDLDAEIAINQELIDAGGTEDPEVGTSVLQKARSLRRMPGGRGVSFAGRKSVTCACALRVRVGERYVGVGVLTAPETVRAGPPPNGRGPACGDRSDAVGLP
ncbi:tetratricopeptide (TPR) repeat protein [Streptomyces sp. SAI-170]|uniref:tetratricopeptide repeat protein n=1 Tax=Streptomyces sp. SAI-170 TaxID=3377729 RepID=UPI003C7E887B